MKITLILNGKTDDDYLIKGFSMYEQRLKHYISFETIVIPALKNTKALSMEQQKQKEGELIFKNIQSSDRLILLDENGKEYNCYWQTYKIKTRFYENEICGKKTRKNDEDEAWSDVEIL